MGYDEPIRIREGFFGSQFMPMIIERHYLVVKYYHSGVFFWVQGVYQPKAGDVRSFDLREMMTMPREDVVREIHILKDQILFKPYRVRILFHSRQWQESSHMTLQDAISARDRALKRHCSIGEYVIYRRSLRTGDVNVSGRERILFFMRFNEPTKYSGDVLWEDYFSTSVAAYTELRRYEREKSGLGAVYGAVDYVCGKPHLSIPVWEGMEENGKTAV